MDPKAPKIKRQILFYALLILMLIQIACSGLTFLKYEGSTVIIQKIIWISIAALFVVLALLYSCMYCALRSTLHENVFEQLDSERDKMRVQFYLFGSSYLIKGVFYSVEGYLW